MDDTANDRDEPNASYRRGMPMDIKGMEKHDKHMAAVHEAGHLTVALALGLRGRAWLFRSNTQDVGQEKTWVGRSGLSKVPAAVAVAGCVAACAETEGYDGISCEDIAYVSLDEMASPTDLAAIPTGFKKRCEAIMESLGLLQRHDAFFRRACHELETYENIPDGMAQDLFDQHLLEG